MKDAAGRINENSLAVRGEMSPVIAEMAGVEQKSFIMVQGARQGASLDTRGTHLGRICTGNMA